MIKNHDQEVRVTPSEAARQLGIATKTLKKLLIEEGFDVFHTPASVEIRQSDVDRLKAARWKPYEG